MKIGLTIRTFNPQSGGLQSHAQRLAKELEKSGHEVVILTISVSLNPTYRDYFFFSESFSSTKVNDLNIFVLRHSRFLNWFFWIISKCIVRPTLYPIGISLYQWFYSSQAIAILKGVDIIHHVGQAHELIGFVGASVAHRLSVPFVVQPTAHPGQWGDSDFDLCLYQLAKRLFVHTNYEAQSLQKLGLTGPFDIVGNGIDDRSDGQAKRFRDHYQIDGFIILFLGRKTSDKGYPLLKQAFYQLREIRNDITLVCMGPPSEERTNLKSNDLQQGIIEIGFGLEQEKHDALAACDIFCVPSEGESFGLVYMEAGRYHKAIIARKLPVLQELLGKQEAGLLIGLSYGKDNQVLLDAEELKDAILSLINDQELAHRLGQNAYSVSDKFVWSKVVSQFETAYFNAIAN